MIIHRFFIIVVYVLGCTFASLAYAVDEDALEFDDQPLSDLLHHPAWFKDSFLELPDDLQEAIDADKKGIIVYFGQRRCAYCRQLMEVNFKLPDIVKYTRKNFDVIAIDIWSPEEVTDPLGNVMTQQEYAQKMQTNFTPSLVFYNAKGEIALRLRGYYAPYQFRAALEYVADEHYKREPFSVYIARGDSTLRFEAEDMVEETFFTPAPYTLDRSHFPSDRPLAVFFEQGNCHACDILHTQPLQQPAIKKLFSQFDSVQVNMWSDTPVITPQGKSTTAKQWARSLGLFYAPSVLFFDEQGKEVARLESVVHFFRLRNVLNYIVSKGYKNYPNFQLWRKDFLSARIQ